MTGRALGVVASLLAALVVTLDGQETERRAAGGWAAVEVVRFTTPPGVALPGERAVSSLTVRNAGSRPRTVWIGYSVQDPNGRWYDVPSHAVTIPAAGIAPAQAKAWPVPASAVSGFHRVAMAVWDAAPETERAVRLASADRRDAFRVARVRDTGDALDTTRWLRADHPLGRGLVRPEHVGAGGGRIRLHLPVGHCDGAEIRTAHRHGHGRYTARLKTPRAPGSLTAFFLYEDVAGGNDEIDIEILNDGSRRVLLSAWVGGEQTRTATVLLPFDPAAGFHDYTIDHRPGELRLEADGRLLARWTGGLPARPMRVSVNAWWPAWLSCDPAADRAVEVERIAFRRRPPVPAEERK